AIEAGENLACRERVIFRAVVLARIDIQTSCNHVKLMLAQVGQEMPGEFNRVYRSRIEFEARCIQLRCPESFVAQKCEVKQDIVSDDGVFTQPGMELADCFPGVF